MMNKKVFNIGFNKSGTSTLTDAMEILGYNVLHWRKGNRRIFDIIRKNKEEGKKLLQGLEKYNFISDFGGENIFKELDKQYPGSKFILTVRKTKEWIKSREKHVKRNQSNPSYKYDFIKIEKRKWKREKRKIISETKRYFKNRPNDFLIINICKGEGWEKLCPFLSKKIPEDKFPYLNKSISNQILL